MGSNVFATGTAVGQFFDKTADVWPEISGHGMHVGYWPDAGTTTMEAANDRFTELMIQKIRVGEGDRVLDVGCGIGGPALLLARSTGAQVQGVTVSAEQVRRATANAERTGLSEQASFLCADAMEMSFPAASFDAAWFFESIMFMPDRVTALARATGFLRPGSRIAVAEPFQRLTVTPDRREQYDACLDNFGVRSLVTFDDYPTLLRRAGLEPMEIIDVTDETMTSTSDFFLSTLRAKKSDLGETTDTDIVAGIEAAYASLAETPEIGYLVAVGRKTA